MGGKQSLPPLNPSELTSDKKVIVYGSDNCPYCFKVKSIFEELKVDIDYRNIDQSKDREAEYNRLSQTLKYDTIPMVFIKNQFIGGCDKIKDL